jgi:CheY-like chemotaxis protein
MATLTLQLFGETFSALDQNGLPVVIPSRRAEALLVALALRPEGAGRASLAELVTGSADATREIEALLAELRHALRTLPEDVLLELDGHVMLDRNAVEVDALRFDELLGAASITSVRKAADLYHANLLTQFVTDVAAFDAWLAERRVMYWRSALLTLGNLLAAQIRAGWWEEAIETAGRLLALDPSQEVVHRTLIRLQLEQGRPDAAMRRYEECADLLRREYGREPSAETLRVREDIASALERSPAPREVTLGRTNGPLLALVVEDDLVSSALIEGYLADAGFEVVAVGDGGAALIELGRRHFDLILLDINVPTLSGLKVFEIMLQKQVDTPAIFVTGVPGSEVEMQSLEMGAAGFLRKPVRKEVLLRKIRGILQRKPRTPAANA